MNNENIRTNNELYQKLYELELWWELILSQCFSYTRIPWWWLMIKDNWINYWYSCFIPYDDEFKKTNPF